MKFLIESKNSNSMILYTLQDKSVLNKLKNNKVYIADYRNIFDTDYSKQYRRLAELHNLKNCPIFCATTTSKEIISSSSLNKENKVLLKLQVPTSDIHMHDYYDWTDYLYYDTQDA